MPNRTGTRHFGYEIGQGTARSKPVRRTIFQTVAICTFWSAPISGTWTSTTSAGAQKPRVFGVLNHFIEKPWPLGAVRAIAAAARGNNEGCQTALVAVISATLCIVENMALHPEFPQALRRSGKSEKRCTSANKMANAWAISSNTAFEANTGCTPKHRTSPLGAAIATGSVDAPESAKSPLASELSALISVTMSPNSGLQSALVSSF